MASLSDGNQAAALSRSLRRAGWNPVSSDSARRYQAGLIVRRGTLGMGASVCLASDSESELTSWAQDMAKTLEELGYAFERSELKDGIASFHRVKKAERS